MLFAAILPLFATADLTINQPQTVTVPNGPKVVVKLVALEEARDTGQSAVRNARIRLNVDGKAADLDCANYRLPVTIGSVQADCPVTGGYMTNSHIDHWKLKGDARVRLWPAGSTWMQPSEFGYPLKQRWFLTQTQMANEPTYSDRGEMRARKGVYYHAGLDLGGTEAMAEVVAATDGVVVSLGKEVHPDHRKDTPVAERYDVIYLLDSRGWYYRYSHLYSFEPTLKLGASVKKGDRLGVLGKEGGSGGWSHLHFEAVARQPSGEWGTQEAYAFLWEAYLRDFKPDVVAVARPHLYAKVGEPVTLDASRSYVRSGAARFRWKLSDGRVSAEAKPRMRYDRVGTYSELLEVTDAQGHKAFDFATVNIFNDEEDPITINANYSPTLNLRAGQALTFKVRTFGLTSGEETWDFGDGSPARSTKSDGNARKLAPDGYAVIQHTYTKPGDYIVTVKNGTRATTHLWVPVR